MRNYESKSKYIASISILVLVVVIACAMFGVLPSTKDSFSSLNPSDFGQNVIAQEEATKIELGLIDESLENQVIYNNISYDMQIIDFKDGVAIELPVFDAEGNSVYKYNSNDSYYEKYMLVFGKHFENGRLKNLTYRGVIEYGEKYSFFHWSEKVIPGYIDKYKIVESLGLESNYGHNVAYANYMRESYYAELKEELAIEDETMLMLYYDYALFALEFSNIYSGNIKESSIVEKSGRERLRNITNAMADYRISIKETITIDSICGYLTAIVKGVENEKVLTKNGYYSVQTTESIFDVENLKTGENENMETTRVYARVLYKDMKNHKIMDEDSLNECINQMKCWAHNGNYNGSANYWLIGSDYLPLEVE